MAKFEHLEILKQGVQHWNKWREELPFVRPEVNDTDVSEAELCDADLHDVNFRRTDLSGAHLDRAKLENANLAGADLRNAVLRKANLAGANLTGVALSRAKLTMANLCGANLMWGILTNAEFVGADLSEAELSNANLTGANLSDANFTGADLSGANFSGANLEGTDFTSAHIAFTNFADVDLSAARGLETVIPEGPSSVGIETIYKSRGKIHDEFLRRCGVPDDFITFIGSIVGRPIEFYSCFISYSAEDQKFAERLWADLQANGVRCWFAPHDLKSGRKLYEQIDEAIRLHDKLLLILSLDSMNSEWVKTEIAKARKREVNEGKKVLFPLDLVPFDALRDWECFDADTGKDLAKEIREYYIRDFTNWKDHDSYQATFQRLVSDLKAAG